MSWGGELEGGVSGITGDSGAAPRQPAEPLPLPPPNDLTETPCKGRTGAPCTRCSWLEHRPLPNK